MKPSASCTATNAYWMKITSHSIYCTVFCNEVPDLYAKHTLMDYAHGGYPFVVSTFEKTSKRLYASRSIPEVGEAFQQVVKVETDASIDRQSLSTLPPLEHPLGAVPQSGPWGEYLTAHLERYDLRIPRVSMPDQ